MCVDAKFKRAMDELTQKFGYLDVKQSSRVRGRKLRNWRRRWVVFTKMSNLSSDEIVGKIDLYDSEEKWRNDPSNKITFILEHVTAVRQSDSRTHPHAFEIVERQPSLVLSGTTELESYSWFLSLQQIFTPDMVESKKDSYTVTIVPNEESTKWKLEGEYCLTVSENGVSLIETVDSKSNIKISWGLSTLIRFNMEKEPKTEALKVLAIQCGPNSPTGESIFRFVSDEVKEIIKTIRHYICIALAHKQNVRQNSSNVRARSISATYSEKNFMNLLDSHAVWQDPSSHERSESDSSGSTLPSSAPPIGTNSMTSESSVNQTDVFPWTLSLKSNSELEVLDEVDEHSSTGRLIPIENKDSGCVSESPSIGTPDQPVQRISALKGSSHDPGYSVIRDVSSQPNPERDAQQFMHDVKTQETLGVTNISAQVSEEIILPASFIDEGKSFDSIDALHGSELNSSFISGEQDILTTSHDGTGQRHIDPIYQEVDKVDKQKKVDTLVPPPGALNRRRSSSTPDLQAFWKKLGFDTDFENVYEELDEHRRTFFSRPRRKEKEIPPALPARPFTLNFHTAPKDNGNQPVVRLKNSFSGKSSSSKGRSSQASKAKTCTCQHPRPNKRSYNSKRSTCCECGRKMKPLDSSKGDRNGIVCPSESADENMSSNGSAELFSSGLDAKGDALKSQLRKSSSLDQSEVGCLVDIGEDNALTESLETPQQQTVRATQPCSKADPLIGFFLDDENFDTNPLVTGQMTGKSQVDFLKSFDDGRAAGKGEGLFDHHFSKSGSQQGGFTNLPMRPRRNTNSPPSKLSFHDSFNSIFGESWSSKPLFPPISASSNLETNRDSISPSFSPFSSDPFALSDANIRTPQSNANLAPESSYMTMANNTITSPLPNMAIDPFGRLQDHAPSLFHQSLASSTTSPGNWTTFDINDGKATPATTPARSDFGDIDPTNDNVYISPGWVTSH